MQRRSQGSSLFTNERLQFRLGDIGNIISLNPENVSDLWERFYSEDLFTEEDIKTIVGIYGEGKESGGVKPGTFIPVNRLMGTRSKS